MMRLPFSGRHVLACALSLGLIACGDDDPTDPGNEDDLTEAEATVMMEALVEAGGFAFTGSGAPAAVFEASQTMPVEGSEPCPVAGSIDLAGSVTFDEATGATDMNVTQTHQSCQVSHGGTTWTFDGNPSITFDFSLLVDDDSFTLNGTQAGGIAWSEGGRSGACQINVAWDFAASGTAGTYTGSVSGSVCGHSVDQTIDFDWDA